MSPRMQCPLRSRIKASRGDAAAISAVRRSIRPGWGSAAVLTGSAYDTPPLRRGSAPAPPPTALTPPK